MKHIQPSKQGASCTSSNLLPSPQYPSQGSVTIPMTNDYLFRAFLQRNNKALKGLSGALLHLEPEEITSVEIMNPIVLGSSTNDKTFILDIRVCLNNHAILNLEMQVVNQHNWVERSLSYLCRNFDNLDAGEAYEDIRPIIQIGILNFTLFEEHPEFYASFKLLNVKDYTLYSDKLCLSVLDLTRIDLATEKDKHHQLDYWASLFKSTTWEEITMLAEKNEYIAEAAGTIYRLSQDEQIRMECEAREDYYRTQVSIQRKLAKMGEMEKREAELLDSLKEKENSIKEKEDSLKETENSLREKEDSLKKTKDNLREAEDNLRETEDNLRETEDNLRKTNAKLAETEAERTALASQLESLLSWAKKHGYNPDTDNEVI